jgi:hypothetical protein
MKKFLDLNIDATIEIICQDNIESKVIHDSLLPDNIGFPKNLEFLMKTTDSSVSLKLKFSSNIEEKNSMETLLNTFDEIMEHTGIIKNVIKND